MKRGNLIIIILIGVLNLQAQEDAKVPLRQVLQQLEQTQPINFTYLDETVEGIMVTPPAADQRCAAGTGC